MYTDVVKYEFVKTFILSLWVLKQIHISNLTAVKIILTTENQTIF